MRDVREDEREGRGDEIIRAGSRSRVICRVKVKAFTCIITRDSPPRPRGISADERIFRHRERRERLSKRVCKAILYIKNSDRDLETKDRAAIRRILVRQFARRRKTSDAERVCRSLSCYARDSVSPRFTSFTSDATRRDDFNESVFLPARSFPSLFTSPPSRGAIATNTSPILS